MSHNFSNNIIINNELICTKCLFCGARDDAPDLPDICRKAPVKKAVRFHFSGLPVTHWDRQTKQTVPVHLDVEDPYLDFKHQLFTIFTEEITTRDIRLYSLPYGFKSYDERYNVNNREDFMAIVNLYMELDRNRPLLYVYNYENESPKKPPAGHIELDDESTDISHFTEESNTCKETANNTCLFCEMKNLAGVGLQGCHIYECERYKKLKNKQEKIAKLDEFLISHIHQQNNFICLCSKCHSSGFDPYLICVHPVSHTLMISPVIRDGLTGNGKFGDHHGKTIVFPGMTHRWPTQQLLIYRYNGFITKHQSILKEESSKKKNLGKTLKFHTCCYCTELFESIEEANNHCSVCSLASQLKSSVSVSEGKDKTEF